MKKILFAAFLLIASTAFGQTPPSQNLCPDRTVSIYTDWMPQNHPTKTACVATVLVTGLPANGKCPSDYMHTAESESPHNDVCVSVYATYLPHVTEKSEPQTDEASSSTLRPSAQSPNGARWAMFAKSPWPNAALQSELAKVCGLPFDPTLTPDSSVAANLEVLVIRLNQARESFGWTMPILFVPVESNIVNAWTHSNVGEQHGALICMTSGDRQVAGDAPEEFAAMLAHEMGHAVDTECYNYAQRSRLGQQSCEARADSIGLAIIIRAGYNPYSFAGFFGRLEMFSGDTSSGILARLVNVITSNHPITPDRIQRLHQMLIDNQQGKFILPGNRIVVPPAQP